MAFSLIHEFGDYSGFRINLAQIDTVPTGWPTNSEAHWRRSFSGLVEITIQLPEDICKLLCGPLSIHVKKSATLEGSPFTVIGENMFKMIYLPKFLYILANVPLYVPKKTF